MDLDSLDAASAASPAADAALLAPDSKGHAKYSSTPPAAKYIAVVKKDSVCVPVGAPAWLSCVPIVWPTVGRVVCDVLGPRGFSFGDHGQGNWSIVCVAAACPDVHHSGVPFTDGLSVVTVGVLKLLETA